MHMARDMRTALVGLGVAVAATSGCGGSALSPMTIDEVPARFQAAECRLTVTCGIYPDEASCEQALPIAAAAQAVVAAVKRGTMTFDGTLATQCLSELGVDCTNQDPPICEQVFQGRVAAGGSCVLDGECMGGGPCMKPQDCTDSCCAGTCGPAKLPVGGDCSQDISLCARGSHCESPGTCVADVPVPAPATGASCDPTGSAACARSDDYCDAAAMKCTWRRPVGAACATSNECLDEAFCGSNGACVARAGVGAACGGASGTQCLSLLDCESGVCTVFLKPSPSCGP